MFFFKTHKQKQPARHYFDYASSTPRDEKMVRSFDTIPIWCSGANPSSLHKEGVEIKKYRERARALVAGTLHAHTDEVYFTSGATESITTALIGVLAAHTDKRCALFISPFEHSVTTALAERSGVDTYYFEQKDGVVDVQTLTVPQEAQVVIISVLYVQNEVGTVQPIKDIAKRIRKLKKEHPEVVFYFHVDATQAPLFYALDVRALGVDMMSVGSTKLYSTKGVGSLYIRRGVPRTPLFVGGSQEMGIRSGTEPVALMYEYAQAFSYAQKSVAEAFAHTKTIQEYCEARIAEFLPQCAITCQASERAPHITHITFTGIESELMVLELDARGFALSSKSACKNDDDAQGGIVEVLFPKENKSALRISYGRETTKKDVDTLISALQTVFTKYESSANTH